MHTRLLSVSLRSNVINTNNGAKKGKKKTHQKERCFLAIFIERGNVECTIVLFKV